MNNHEYCIYISKLALKAILYEVSATPKPGLVDRNNSGAHKDMDFFTFLDSSVALSDYFYRCAEEAMSFDGEDYSELLRKLRPIGKQAEIAMFDATCGINTHKGIIFSAGFIAAAAGLLFKKYNKTGISAVEISETVKLMARDVSEELKDADNKDKLTYGEMLYKKFGAKGIRGEVENGFATVLENSLPALKELLDKKICVNNALVHVLLILISRTEDSNILGRHNKEVLEYARKSAHEALRQGGCLTEKGRKTVEEMDRDFIERNISPGGSADLVAVTILLYLIENGGLI